MDKSKKKQKMDYMERDFSAGTIRIYDGGKKRNDYGSISLVCGFVIYITIVETKKGRFISYPSCKTKKDEYINLAYCFDKYVIKELNDILDEMYED